MPRLRSLAIASATAALLAPTLAACGGDDPTVAGPTTSTTPQPAPPATDPASSGDPGVPTGEPGSQDRPPAPAGDATITQTIKDNGELKTLSTAITASDLAPLLAQPGPYTVFAPSDDAFTKLGSQLDTLLQPSSKADLSNVLRYHVVSGKLKAKDLKDGELLTTLQGTRLRVNVKGDQIELGNRSGDTQVVSADLPASNGVIHVVDTVLQPRK